MFKKKTKYDRFKLFFIYFLFCLLIGLPGSFSIEIEEDEDKKKAENSEDNQGFIAKIK